MTPPVALSVAGSDSGGGAGIQADLATFAALGVFGTTAITCITAQNSFEVRDVFALPPALVRSQVEAVLDDMEVAAAKAGLLVTEAIVKEVAALAPRLPHLVVDPVFASSSGRALADPATVRAYRDHLLGCAEVLTPNLPEAEALLGRRLLTVDDACSAAKELGNMSPFVVVKGGHIDGVAVSTDVVWDGRSCWQLSRPRVETANTHGSGCTFSAAVAAGLAQGMRPAEAVRLANDYVNKAIRGGAGWRIGTGQGPLDHFGWEEAK
jgi:hydroxymethylpyrimidine/phosphomethylpyrimidine kinase